MTIKLREDIRLFFVRIIFTVTGILYCKFFRRILVIKSQFPKAENLFAVGIEYSRTGAAVSMSIAVYSGLWEMGEGFEEEITNEVCEKVEEEGENLLKF